MEVQGMFPVHRDLQITEPAGQLDRPITPACQVRFISATLYRSWTYSPSVCGHVVLFGDHPVGGLDVRDDQLGC
jgi:hypothetical protein